MPIQVLMPALSPTMEKGNLAKWLKKEGDDVKSGDVIAEIETDKATMEVEAVDEGTLGKILVPEGTADVAVNTPIAMILGEGESVAARARQGRRQAGAAAEGRRGRAAAAKDEGDAGRPKKAPRQRSSRRRAESRSRARARRAGRHRDGHHDHARGACATPWPRRCGATRRVRDGRGGRRISGRLQGHAGPAAGVRRAAA